MSLSSTHSTQKHVEDTLARPPRAHTTQEIDAITFSEANDTRRVRESLQSRTDSSCEGIVPESESEAERRSVRSGTEVYAHERSPSRSWNLTPEALGYGPLELENASNANTSSVVLAEAGLQTPAPVVRSDNCSPRSERPNLTIVTDVLPSNESNLSTEAIETPTGTPRVHFLQGRSDEITEVPRTPVTEPRPDPSPVSERSNHSPRSPPLPGRRTSQKSLPVRGHWSDAFVAQPVEVPPQIRSERSRRSPRRSSVSSKASRHSRGSLSSLQEPSPHQLHYTPIYPTPPVLPEIRSHGFEYDIFEGLERFLHYKRRFTLPPIRCVSPLDPSQIVGESEDDIVVEPPSSDEEEPAEQAKAPVEFDPLDLPAVIERPTSQHSVTQSASEPSTAVADNGTILPAAGSLHNASASDMSATLKPPSVHANLTIESPEMDVLREEAQPPPPPSHLRGLHLRNLLRQRAGRETSERPRWTQVSFGWAISQNAVASTRPRDQTVPEGGYEFVGSDTSSDCGTLATMSTEVACCPPWRC